ncbi:MAG TPA: hypothetical protein VI160_03085 [Gemmatimonadales bacterium]
MTLTRDIWFRIAAVLSVANLIGIGYAAGAGEGPHAMVHGVLALGFAAWAVRLRRAPAGGDVARLRETLEEQARALEDAQFTLSNQTRELAELQERVDFAERMLAQARDRARLPDQDKRK